MRLCRAALRAATLQRYAWDSALGLRGARQPTPAYASSDRFDNQGERHVRLPEDSGIERRGVAAGERRYLEEKRGDSRLSGTDGAIRRWHQRADHRPADVQRRPKLDLDDPG